jgi:biotin transport system substrate-specific component
MGKKKLHSSSHSVRAALACLFAALLCAGAYISIPLPISPAPLTLDNFFAILGGLLLGPLWGGAASAIYLSIGLLGFPVFSGGRGGITHLLGPTGGYLLGYVVGAALAGMSARKRGAISISVGALLGFSAILALGAAGLRYISGIAWDRAMAVGFLPFIPGDAVKAVLAILVALRLGPFVDSLRSDSGHDA